jgi:hypothetical protein
MSKINKKVAGKFLSEALRNLANEAHDTDGSETKTRAQCLAQLVWDYALGYTKKVRNKEGKLVDQIIEPRTWAITLLFDRLEGRVPLQNDETESTVSLLSRIEKLNFKQFQDLET